MIKKTPFLLLLVFFISCGLEDFIILPQLPEARVFISDNRVAVSNMNLLGPSAPHARNYSIYYRIYISGHSEPGIINISEFTLGNISAALLNNFRAILPYTDPLDERTVDVGATFRNRGYFEMYIRGNYAGAGIRNISTLLDTNFPAGIEINFTDMQIPSLTLTAGGQEFTLIRSNGDGLFEPRPLNRYFIDHEELNDNANAIITVNRDTSPDPRIPAGSPLPRFTYISMYIVIKGFNPDNFATIYGRPTHLGIFRLPN